MKNDRSPFNMAAMSTRYCRICGKIYEVGKAKFCFSCGSNLEVETAENLQLVSSVSSSTSQINANNVPSMNGKKPTSTLSLEAFRARKETNRSTFFRPSKKTKRPEKDVTIRIGVLQFNPERAVLKPQWGKTLPLSVDRHSNYSTILEKALTKRKAHDRHFKKMSEVDEYQLLYPDGSQAIFLPGQPGKFFDLRAYKEDLGTPYSRITFYLCSSSDIASCEHDPKTEDMDSESNDKTSNYDWPDEGEVQPTCDAELNIFASTSSLELPPVKCVDLVKDDKQKVECPTCRGYYMEEEIACHADICAENAHKRAFFELIEDLPNDEPLEELEREATEHHGDGSTNETEVLSTSEILKALTENLKSQSRINVRRGQLFTDYLEVRKRCYWHNAEQKLKVVFIGEPAEDTGGPRREFLTGLDILHQL